MLEETQFENRRNTNQTQRLRARLRASRVLGSMVSTIFSAQNGLFCWHHYVANLKITKKSAHLVAPTCKSVLGAANFVYVSYRNHHHHQHHIFVWNVNDCGDNTFKSGRVWGSIITHKLPQRRGGMRTEEWCSVVRAAGRVSRERRSGNNIVLCCNLVPMFALVQQPVVELSAAVQVTCTWSVRRQTTAFICRGSATEWTTAVTTATSHRHAVSSTQSPLHFDRHLVQFNQFSLLIPCNS